MNIETEIFKKSKINYNKLLDYGFTKDKNTYTYKKSLIDNFEVFITVDKEDITGKIFDTLAKEEYTNFRLDTTSGYSTIIREKYEELLNDIAKKCCEFRLFSNDQANRINNCINDIYNDNPEFLWDKFQDTCIYRNPKNKKWYALITSVDKSKLDEKENGIIEIINLKLEPIKIQELLTIKGFYKAYHMNKKYWISIALDNSIPDTKIFELIKESHSYTE